MIVQNIGSTRYCVDKNYAGVLIIWDRIFGTFEAERRDEPLVYGLIEQVTSYNPFYLEVTTGISRALANAYTTDTFSLVLLPQKSV